MAGRHWWQDERHILAASNQIMLQSSCNLPALTPSQFLTCAQPTARPKAEPKQHLLKQNA